MNPVKVRPKPSHPPPVMQGEKRGNKPRPCLISLNKQKPGDERMQMDGC